MQQLKRWTDRFWYMTPEDVTDRPILGAIVGTEHTLMIDAGNSETHARLFLSELERAGVAQPSLLVLTHWHWDHVFGLSALGAIPSFASRETKQEVERMATYEWDDSSLDLRVEEGIEIEFCATAIRQEFGDARTIDVRLPTVTFEGTITFDLGGVHAVCRHVGGDHAADAVIVYVPEEKLLFLGDAVYPNLYAPSRRYTAHATLRLLDAIDEFDADAYVWSHERVVSYEEYTLERDRLRHIAKLTLDSPVDASGIRAAYEARSNRPLDEEEEELVQYFVAGSTPVVP